MLKNFYDSKVNIFKILKMIWSDMVLPFRFYMPWGQFESDVIFVAGDAWQKKLERLKVKSKIIKTGHPATDRIFNDVKKYEKLEKKSKKFRILLMTTPLVEHKMMEKNIWKNLIKNVISKCNEIENSQLIIKIHPTGERIENYKEILKEMNLEIEVLQNEDLGKIVSNVDVIITYGVSSGTHYGIFMKKPILVYNPINMTLDEMPFVRENMATEIKDIKNLENIKKMKPVNDEQIEKFVSKYMYKFDGLASYRISNILLEQMKKNKTSKFKN